MNERDSDSAAALLVQKGLNQVSTENEADVVVLNTCSVRDQAERKAIGKLGFLKELRSEKPHLVLGIMGCMAQSRGEELLKKLKYLDFALGTDQIHRLPEIVTDVLEDRKNRIALLDRTGADTPGIDAHRMDEDFSDFSAFVSISRGCCRFCSYCIVPYVRGPERSRDADSIVNEVEMLASKGVTEIMLLGQNVASYGLDGTAPPIADDVSPFAELLERISDVEGIRRIRFTSPHPAFFNTRLIRAVAELPKVCKSMHLPLQSGSDEILRKMNRPYDSSKYLSIVNELKRLVPQMTFSTDVIVGFPTETEEDFNNTRRVMNEVGFDNAYIFKYSPRKGTKSAEMTDDVPAPVKLERNKLLLADMEERLISRNKELVGTVFEVLSEGVSKRNAARWSGRTDTFKTVVFEPSRPITKGDYVQVKITRATSMTLYGDMI